MFSSLSIRHRLMAVVVLAVVFLSLLAGVNLYSQSASNEALRDVRDHTVKPLLAVQEIDNSLREVRFRIAGVLLDQLPAVGSRNHLKEVRERVPKAWQEFKEQQHAGQMSPEEQELVAKIETGIAALPGFFDKVDAAFKGDDKKVLTTILEEEWPVVFTKTGKPLGLLIPQLTSAMNKSFEAREARGRQLNTLAIAAYVLCVVLLLVLVLPLLSSLARGINDLKAALARVASGDLTVRAELNRSDELGEMARSLDGTIASLRDLLLVMQRDSEVLVDSSSRLTGELSQVMERGRVRSELMERAGNSINDMSTSAQTIADGSTQVAEASSASRDVATRGDARMEENIAATQRVEVAVDGSVAIIAELSAATERINAMTGVIREIADQTNLLALNAAIEAARAGEQGRGFAVVADEVRKLAERTSSSTGEIAATVNAIRQQTQSAVDAMKNVSQEVREGGRFARETRETLGGIVSAASRVTTLSHDIAMATRQQLVASESTANDMSQAATVSAENALSIRKVGEITQEVDSMVLKMQQLIARFKLN
jgi:methyl-accepting chemotaxis protein